MTVSWKELMTTTRDQGDADEAYIIRSEQKDAYHLAQLASLAEPVARGVLGERGADDSAIN